MGLGGGASGTQGPACCGGLRHPRRKSWIVLTPYPSARSPQTIAETAIVLKALRVPLRQASRSGPSAPQLVQAARRSRAGCTSVQERELTGNTAGCVVRSRRRRATLAPCPETSVSRVGACREGPTTFGAGPRRRIRAPRHVGGAAGCVIACQSYTRYRMTRPTNVQRRRAWSNRKATAGPRTTARESQLLVTDRRTPTVRTARAITTRRNFEAGGDDPGDDSFSSAGALPNPQETRAARYAHAGEPPQGSP